MTTTSPQARAAAADLKRQTGASYDADLIAEGRMDEGSFVEAFYRFEQTIRAQAEADALERAARKVEQWLDPIMATQHENDTYRSIAQDIREMKGQDHG